ncbi:MAG: branched-chain amino acid ABC transporter permease [Burkholderiales bacterium]
MRAPVSSALWPLLLLGVGLAFPFAALALGQEFYLSVAARIGVYAVAATSLNLVLGYGGLVSFGHAAFFGLGAYTVAVLSVSGVGSGWVAFPAAVAVAALAALLIGAISLRTRGVYFIMITLAFAQMLFYLANSIKAWGGDEGLNLAARSAFGLGIDLGNDLHFYLLVLGVLTALLVALQRLDQSRFGQAIRAIRLDEIRAESIGFPVARYQLLLFVIGGALGGLAGALMVNQQRYVNPNLLYWTQSGTLMVMVILGGVGSRWGGLLGAAALLLLEETLSLYTIHWQFWVGWLLLAVVLFAPRGLAGLASWRRAAARARH